MNEQLNLNAISAWDSFCNEDYYSLERSGVNVYNYFVHHPADILNLDNPLLIGRVFQVCLGFRVPDEDIQEVRAENAFICFSQALESQKTSIHDEASARLMILLIRDRRHLINKIQSACQGSHPNPYNFLSMFDSELPPDMPMDTNTKTLFAAYYLYDCIMDKANVSSAFTVPMEERSYINVKDHVLDNCRQIDTSLDRIIELGKIVVNKVSSKLRNDIESYSGML